MRSLDFAILQSELLEINVTQVKEVTLIQDKTRNIKISPTQASHEVVNESTKEKTSNCENTSICMFTKYVYTFRTARRYTTPYEKDRVINNDKVKRNKKCRKLEWCINDKKSSMYK
jgi:hypothetical protein